MGRRPSACAGSRAPQAVGVQVGIASRGVAIPNQELSASGEVAAQIAPRGGAIPCQDQVPASASGEVAAQITPRGVVIPITSRGVAILLQGQDYKGQGLQHTGTSGGVVRPQSQYEEPPTELINCTSQRAVFPPNWNLSREPTGATNTTGSRTSMRRKRGRQPRQSNPVMAASREATGLELYFCTTTYGSDKA